MTASKGSLKGRVGRYRQVKLSVIGRRSREARQQHVIFYPSLYDTLRRNDEGLVRFCSRHRSISAYLLSRAPLTLQYAGCIPGRRVVSGNRWSGKHVANHDNHSWCRLLFLVRGDLWGVPSCGQGLAEMEWDFEVGEGAERAHNIGIENRSQSGGLVNYYLASLDLRDNKLELVSPLRDVFF